MIGHVGIMEDLLFIFVDGSNVVVEGQLVEGTFDDDEDYA